MFSFKHQCLLFYRDTKHLRGNLCFEDDIYEHIKGVVDKLSFSEQLRYIADNDSFFKDDGVAKYLPLDMYIPEVISLVFTDCVLNLSEEGVIELEDELGFFTLPDEEDEDYDDD